MEKRRSKKWLEMFEKWKKLHTTQAEDIDACSDKGGAEWESLCMGWCLAQGFTVDEASDFYQAMIGEGFF